MRLVSCLVGAAALCASRRVLTSPYALNFARCCETADIVTARMSAMSHTQTSFSSASR